VRWVLNQAAQTAKRHPDFAATYHGIANRRDTKIATVAVTRKLLTRAYHLLTDAQPVATETNQNTMRVARTAQTGRGHQARACSPQRHEPATKLRSII